MWHALDEVGPPDTEIFRIGRRRDCLSPPPWDRALTDGTFGNRFDDPSAAEGRPPADRFRCLYCGTTAEAAFGEVLAGKRVPISVLAKLADAVDDDEPVIDTLAGASVDMADPAHPRGIVSADWQSRHQIGRTTLKPALRFADVMTVESRQYLRYVLAEKADALGIDDVDCSAMLNKNHRQFTQACARHIYDLRDPEGVPLYAGIRYLSRHNAIEWECWAIFFDRIDHDPGFPGNIMPDNEALQRIAHSFDLSIEGPGGVLLRP